MGKKLYDVSVLGATVCYCIKDERVGFLTSGGVIYWLNFDEDKTFSKAGFKEGQSVWVYVAKEVGRIISVVPDAGEKLEDLPPIDPVEI